MICVLGSDAASFYVASKIKEVNDNVFLLSNKLKADNEHIITIKEDGRFQKKQIKIEVKNYIDRDIDLLIISAPIKNLKAELTTLDKKKIIDAKILCVSGIENTETITQFTEKNVELAYIKGYFTQKNNSVNVLGKSPSISFENKTSDEIVEVFKKSAFDIELFESQATAFWDWFGTYVVVYIMSCVYKKPIFELLKNKEHREIIETLANEIKVMQEENTKQSFEGKIISEIYSVPNLANLEFSYAETNYIANFFEKQNFNKNELNKLIKTIYKHNLL